MYPFFNQNQNCNQANTAQSNNQVKIFPVMNEQEAASFPIDFDGSLFVLMDIPHGKIFVKQFNYQAGGVLFNRYILDNLQEKPQSSQKESDYITREEFEELKNQIEVQKNTAENRGNRGVK